MHENVSETYTNEICIQDMILCLDWVKRQACVSKELQQMFSIFLTSNEIGNLRNDVLR